jgi:hypothetical protein
LIEIYCFRTVSKLLEARETDGAEDILLVTTFTCFEKESSHNKKMAVNANSVHLEHLVIDSGAIIKGEGFNYFKCSKKFWTVQEVLGEIRDSRARHLLASLPFEIEVREPTDRGMRAVIEFARKTGDLGQLSLVDLKVLALTYDLEVEINGTSFIRTEPKVREGWSMSIE